MTKLTFSGCVWNLWYNSSHVTLWKSISNSCFKSSKLSFFCLGGILRLDCRTGWKKNEGKLISNSQWIPLSSSLLEQKTFNECAHNFNDAFDSTAALDKMMQLHKWSVDKSNRIIIWRLSNALSYLSPAHKRLLKSIVWELITLKFLPVDFRRMSLA